MWESVMSASLERQQLDVHVAREMPMGTIVTARSQGRR
jgi:hypothetical protein